MTLTLPTLHGDAAAATFRDTAGSVYERAVEALADEGIVLGCREDRFCPNEPVRRDQLASMIARATGATATSNASFRDVTGGPHAANIAALAEAGIVKGCTRTSYCPDQATARAQMATMIDRAWSLRTTGQAWFADTSNSVHEPAIERLAANGISAGCSRAVTDFCPTHAVNRGQVALFLARTLELVPRVEPVSLSEREAQVRAQAVAAREAHSVWDDLARCESGGNWSINTGNGYYGGLQFSLSSWRAVGGSGYPHQHSREEQIKRGELLQQRQGWGAWPSCSRKLGLR